MTNEPEKPYTNLSIYRDRKKATTQFNTKKPLLVKNGVLIGNIIPHHFNLLDSCYLHVSDELSVVCQNGARGHGRYGDVHSSDVVCAVRMTGYLKCYCHSQC